MKSKGLMVQSPQNATVLPMVPTAEKMTKRLLKLRMLLAHLFQSRKQSTMGWQKRINLQETIDFPMKYGIVLYFFP